MTTSLAALDAVATARRVLAWAADPDGHDAVPAGQLRNATALAAPGRAALGDLRGLVHGYAARVGAGSPPLGDDSPVGLGALMLAAAIGGRAQPREAVTLAEALPPSRLDGGTGWADALARHAVVAPFVAHPAATAAPAPPPPARDGDEPGEPPEPLREVLLRESPLSGVLHRPPADRLTGDGTPGREIATVIALLRRPRGRTLLVAALGRFSPDPLVLGWRTSMLRMLATSGEQPDVVADAYLEARMRHGTAWDAALRRTRLAFTSTARVPNEQEFAVALYWVPLEDVRLLEVVRRRSGLLASARPALEFVRARRRLLVPTVAA